MVVTRATTATASARIIYWKRDDVRRSRARSVANSVAGPNAPEDDFTSSRHIDFVPTLLGLLGQSSDLQCAGESLLPLMNDGDRFAKQYLSRVGSEPEESEKRKQARLATHDEAHG